MALILKAVGAAANFLMALVITQQLGAEVATSFYVYSYFAIILSVVVRMGMDSVILRQVSMFGRGIVFSTLRRAFGVVVVCSTLCLALGVGFAQLVSWISTDDVFIVYSIALTWSLTQLLAAAFKGIGRNAVAAFFDAIPVSCVVIMAVLLGLVPGESLVVLLVALQAIALVVAFWLMAQACKGVTQRRNRALIWSIDHMAVDALNLCMIWLPFFVVAAVADEVVASNLNIIIKLVMVGNLFIAVFNGVTAKRVTRLLSASESKAALRAARCQTLYALLWVFPVTFAVLYAGYRFHLFAGIQHDELVMAMGFLLLAQLINIVTGPVEVILAMARQSRRLLLITMVSFGVSALALSVFVWFSSLVGAALSILAGVAAFNFISAKHVRHQLGGWVFPRFYSANRI